MDASFQNSICHFIAQLPGMAAWKDFDSKYIYTNECCAQLAGYQKVDQYIGKSDFDWRCEAVEVADQIVKQDELVLQSGKNWTSFNSLKFSNGEMSYYISNKSLLKDFEGRNIGVLFIGTFITQPALIKIMHQLDSAYYQSQKSKVQCSIFPIINRANMSDICNLTLREYECLFFILRGKTAKQIAVLLNISGRTAEHHLENVRRKFEVYSKSQLIEKAMQLGLYYYIPSSLMDNELIEKL